MKRVSSSLTRTTPFYPRFMVSQLLLCNHRAWVYTRYNNYCAHPILYSISCSIYTIHTPVSAIHIKCVALTLVLLSSCYKSIVTFRVNTLMYYTHTLYIFSHFLRYNISVKSIQHLVFIYFLSFIHQGIVFFLIWSEIAFHEWLLINVHLHFPFYLYFFFFWGQGGFVFSNSVCHVRWCERVTTGLFAAFPFEPLQKRSRVLYAHNRMLNHKIRDFFNTHDQLDMLLLRDWNKKKMKIFIFEWLFKRLYGSFFNRDEQMVIVPSPDITVANKRWYFRQSSY